MSNKRKHCIFWIAYSITNKHTAELLIDLHQVWTARRKNTNGAVSEGSELVGMYSWGLQPMTQAA